MGKALSRGRGRKIFLVIIIVGCVVIGFAAGLLVWWTKMIYELSVAGAEIPGFYRSELLTGIITAVITLFGATAGTLIARYGAREATGNLRGVNLPQDAAERMVKGEDQ